MCGQSLGLDGTKNDLTRPNQADGGTGEIYLFNERTRDHRNQQIPRSTHGTAMDSLLIDPQTHPYNCNWQSYGSPYGASGIEWYHISLLCSHWAPVSVDGCVPTVRPRQSRPSDGLDSQELPQKLADTHGFCMDFAGRPAADVTWNDSLSSASSGRRWRTKHPRSRPSHHR